MEVMIVALLIGIFAAMAVPSYRASVEQARADMAAANLRTLWAAERLFYLHTRRFTADPLELVLHEVIEGDGLQHLPGGRFLMYQDPTYVYQIALQFDGGFSATATRAPGTSFGGVLSISSSGAVSGQVTDGRRVIRPGFR